MPYLGRGLEKGNYLKLDDISSQFDGSKTTFSLTVGGSAHVPGSSYSLLVSLSGIVQEGEAAYTLDQNEITFAAAPQAADDCFIISLGTPLGIGVPSNGTVNGTQLAKPLNYDNFFHLDHTNDRVGIGTSLPIQSLDVYDGGIAVRDSATGITTLSFYHNRNELKASIDKTGNNLTFENVDSGIIDYKIGGSSRVSIGSTGKIFFGTDDNTYFYRPGADTLAFVTAGTERLRIRSDGHIGIGTDVVNKLVSIKAVHPFLRLEASDTSDKRLDFQVSSAGIATISAEQSSQQLSFKTTGGEALRIKADGTINITTQNGSLEWTASSGSNPFIRSIGAGQTALEFNTGGNEALRIAHGDLLLGGHGTRIFDDADGENIVVDIYGGTTAGKRGILALGGRTGSDDADIGTIQFVNENNSVATAANHNQSKLVSSIHVKSETSDGNAGSDSGGHLIFSTKPEAGQVTERLRIDPDGNIWANYGNPQSGSLMILDKDGSGEAAIRFYNAGANKAKVALDSSEELTFDVNGDERLRIDSDGNVGIGTTNPKSDAQLDVWKYPGSSAPTLRLGSAIYQSEQEAIRFGRTDHGSDIRYHSILQYHDASAGSNYLRFKLHDGSTTTSQSDVMTLRGDGDVGIGTTNPIVRLEVEEYITAGFSPDASVVVANNILRLENKGSNSFAGMMFRTDGGGDAHFGSYQNLTSANDCTFYFSNQIDSGGGQLLATLDSATGNFVVNKGKVGIGTTVPGAQLHLNGATPGVRITDTDTSGPIHTNIDGASGYLTVDVGSVHRDVIITSVDQANEIVRFTGDGSVNIGGSEQTDHMLYLTSTGDASIHIRADSSNTVGEENSNPSLSMSQDSSNATQFKLGMVGDANQEFNSSIQNACFIHANNNNAQPLQLAHMDNMVLTISNTEQSHFHATSGISIGGLKIANRGNDTGAALLLQGHNNTGTPGQATNTQLTHDGGSLVFEIKHNGTRALHINSTRRIRLPGVPGVAGSGLVNVSIESDGNLCTTTSLREYKTNITSISDTSWLYNLNPVTFNWKKKTEVDGENVWEDTPDGNGTQYGLIAEEVEAVKKEFCYYDNDNKLSGVHYERLIAPLIKALQEQKTEIDSLKAKVSALEGS